MSYCRFSSDNFMCDVYVYADCYGGWTTHVAGNRLVIPPIPEPSFDMVIVRGGTFDKKARKMVYERKIDAVIAHVTATLWGWLRMPHRWSMAIIPRKYIGLPHDGGEFNDPTAGDCADRLVWLRGMGYKVPQYVIDALRAEQEETNEEETHI
ncbi:MAG TPA: hypothetical protein VK149_12075 [Sideroxyarcus sp.]|nr:hypothetical protein [Sideroxyarcus sp.]